MKDKGEDFESCEIKARTLSPMKDKGEDFESYESIKARTFESFKTSQ